MGLTDQMMKLINEEIKNDPQKIGYATAKDDTEIAILLSSSVFKERVVIDAQPSPLNRILVNMTESPNIISATEVTQAKTGV